MTEKLMQGCRVLVTGGAGFIGSHIAEALHVNNEVIVLDDLTVGREDNLRGLDVELVRCSIRDADRVRSVMEGVDYVFHEAAIASVPKSIEDPVGCNQVNVCGTLRVLLEAKEAKVRKVVFASSAAVYGESRTPAKREDEVPSPISPYAVTKLTGEAYCRSFHQVYGLPTCALRYFNVYGPRQDPSSQYSGVISQFMDRAGRGEGLIVHGDGGQTRDFVHVSDVVRANILAAMAEDVRGEVLNIACGESVSVLQLAEEVLALHGMSRDGNVQHRPAREGDIRHSRADIGKAARMLGFEPRKSLRDGLRTIAQGR